MPAATVMPPTTASTATRCRTYQGRRTRRIPPVVLDAIKNVKEGLPFIVFFPLGAYFLRQSNRPPLATIGRIPQNPVIMSLNREPWSETRPIVATVVDDVNR